MVAGTPPHTHTWKLLCAPPPPTSLLQTGSAPAGPQGFGHAESSCARGTTCP